MSSIYSLDNGKNLFIYNLNNFIIMHTCNAENISRQIILAEDYSSSFSSSIYDNTLYYCYLNSKNDIVVRNISDSKVIYEINSQVTPDCYCPFLINYNNSLLIFYFIQNMLNDSYHLQCINPLDGGVISTKYSKDSDSERTLFDCVFPKLPNMTLSPCGEHLLLTFTNSEDDSFLILRMSPSGEIRLLASSESASDINGYIANIASLNEELNKEKESITMNFSSQINDLELKCKQLETENESLNMEVQKYNTVFNNVKSQYRELMDTATQYRNEVIRLSRKLAQKERPNEE